MSPRTVSMTTCFVFALLLGGCAASSSSPAESDDVETDAEEVRAAKIANDAKLVTVLDGLEDVASGGASLAHFSWRENPRAPRAGCRSATAAEAIAAFNETVDGVMEGGDPGEAPQLTPQLIAEAKTRFAALAGTGSYKICHKSTSGFMAAGEITTLFATRGGVRIALETGWED